MVTDTLLEADGIRKHFGGAQALDGVALSISQGEVHCLVGENGAGKSTLGKIVAGVIRPDAGTLRVAGREISYQHPRAALRDGIAIVEQELALVPAMTVADNVLLGLPPSTIGAGRRRGRRRRARAFVASLVTRFSPELDLDAPIESLPVAAQQKVEILRALARNARLIVMDEPTARLAGPEALALLDTIRELVAEGTSVLYVSHFLEEVLAVADRITVLRNGAVVKTGAAAGETPAKLVSAMLGRQATLAFPRKQPPPNHAPVALTVRDLSGMDSVSEVDLEIRCGEIVGLAGLVGSGRTEVARLIFGADRRTRGRIELDGHALTGGSTTEAISRGVAYLPESRKDLGLFLGRSGQENVTLPHLGLVSRYGVLRGREERQVATAIFEQLAVTPANPRMRVSALSGGNQQKVLFGKWLWRAPRVLIADEPTRGIDVGAKFAIYELLVDLAARGTAILLISSEIEEVVELAHRVVVMSRGRPVATLEGDAISEDRILHAAFESAPRREQRAVLG